MPITSKRLITCCECGKQEMRLGSNTIRCLECTRRYHSRSSRHTDAPVRPYRCPVCGEIRETSRQKDPERCGVCARTNRPDKSLRELPQTYQPRHLQRLPIEKMVRAIEKGMVVRG